MSPLELTQTITQVQIPSEVESQSITPTKGGRKRYKKKNKYKSKKNISRITRKWTKTKKRL
jgi:hypothetical protein